jgi:hypothetical protein
MVYELADTEKATALFEGWSETLIWSCLQRVMGKIFVTDLEKPHSALAFVGCQALVMLGSYSLWRKTGNED